MRSLPFLALLVLAGCSEFGPRSLEPVPTAPVSSDDVAQARARWDALGAEDYSFRLQRNCFCSEDWRGPFEVRVRDGAVARVRFQGEEVSTDRALNIDDLFDLLQGAIEGDAASVRAAFDSDTGIPMSLSVDYSLDIADEEVGYVTGDLDVD